MTFASDTFASIWDENNALPYRAMRLNNPAILWVVTDANGMRVSTEHYSRKRDAQKIATRHNMRAAERCFA